MRRTQAAFLIGLLLHDRMNAAHLSDAGFGFLLHNRIGRPGFYPGSSDEFHSARK
jgi:hypothetical protein